MSIVSQLFSCVLTGRGGRRKLGRGLEMFKIKDFLAKIFRANTRKNWRDNKHKISVCLLIALYFKKCMFSLIHFFLNLFNVLSAFHFHVMYKTLVHNKQQHAILVCTYISRAYVHSAINFISIYVDSENISASVDWFQKCIRLSIWSEKHSNHSHRVIYIDRKENARLAFFQLPRRDDEYAIIALRWHYIVELQLFQDTLSFIQLSHRI